MLLCNHVQFVDCLPSSSYNSTNNYKKMKKKVRKKLHPVSTVAKTEEIRVCTNRTCRRQGSFQTLEIIKDLSPPNISVNSSGCLGRCGAGPNVVFLPQGIIVGHCGTAASAARVIARHSDDAIDDAAIRNALDALALRKRAEAEIDQANFSQAEILLSQAIHLKSFGGLHNMYKYRSCVRLAMGNYSGALEDAHEALNLAPQYVEGYMCEGDALVAMEQYDAAEKSYSLCLEIDPTIRHSKPFKSEKLLKSVQPLMSPTV
ncbi:uncharacterized protein [Euphorbia lathyris]|uniref:uncharacterized protein isoform X3 n=1 Tax=Euphorbia lathyris TaxID=212925 RepID=UPI003314124E